MWRNYCWQFISNKLSEEIQLVIILLKLTHYIYEPREFIQMNSIPVVEPYKLTL